MATLNIVVTVPDAQATDILQTITDYLGWTAASGITRAEYLRLQMRNWLKSTYKTAKEDAAASTAAASADAAADAVPFT